MKNPLDGELYNANITFDSLRGILAPVGDHIEIKFGRDSFTGLITNHHAWAQLDGTVRHQIQLKGPVQEREERRNQADQDQ
jgi:hypothetical protein